MIYITLGTNSTRERKKKGEDFNLIWSNFHWALTLLFHPSTVLQHLAYHCQGNLQSKRRWDSEGEWAV